MLRRIFGPKRDKGTGQWRKLHNEELNNLHSSPSSVWVSKLRRRRWAVHVAHMGRVVGNLRERGHLETLGIDGRIILRWICRKWVVMAWTDGLDQCGSRQGQVAATCECSNEPLVFIKCGELGNFLIS